MDQSHVQISSFGFGGTNAHGILWGENKALIADPRRIWQKRMSKMKRPGIRAYGSDPAQWLSDMPDEAAKPGDVWTVTLKPGEQDEGKPLRWEKTEEGLGDELDFDDIGYSIA